MYTPGVTTRRKPGGSFERTLREAEELYGSSGRLRQTYAHLAKRLSDLGIRWALMGGYALILHGVRRFTEDIDVLVTADDLKSLREHLVGSGYAAIRGAQRALRDAETGVRIDFLVSGQFPGDGKPKPVAFPDPAQAGEEIEGVRVVDLRTLVELKLASGMTAKDRLQDLADVQRLIQAHRLGRDFAECLNPYVRKKFLELLG